MKHTLWVERYRPHTIKDCILPASIKATFQEIVNGGGEAIPNMILTGKSGGGKTTVAKAICDELDLNYLFINASENGNIDTLRTEIREFCYASSLEGTRKVVILDEADYLNPNSTQPALRSFIEEFAINVSFILTCNTLSRIIPPLQGRTAIVDFDISVSERDELRKQFMKRLRMILDAEEVEYDPTVLAKLIVKYWPDMRRTINELQRYSMTGIIDAGILEQIKDAPISELLKTLKEKDFKSMRNWCAANNDGDSVRVMRKVYDCLFEVFAPQSVPGVVTLIGEYQYRAAFVQDHEIHLAAFMTELLDSAEFK